MQIDKLIADSAFRYGVPVDIARRLFAVESSNNPQAVSPKGAQGIGQLMPGTAKELGVTDPFNVNQNVPASMKYLRQQFDRFGDWQKALAAYNAGPTRMASAGGDISQMPAETRAYVGKVAGMAKDYSDIFPVEKKVGADYSDLFPAAVPGSSAPIFQPELPVEDPGAMRSALIGAGRGIDQLVKGAQQLYYKATGDDAELARIANEQTSNTEAYNKLRSIRPMATALGEAAPYMAVPALGPLATAGVMGAAGAMKYGTGQERLQNAVLEGAAGGIGAKIGKAIGNVLAPGYPSGRELGKAAVTGTQRDILKTARDLGMRPRLSQETGSKLVSQIEDWASQTPGGISRMAANQGRNVDALNRVAAKQIGQNADNVGPDVLAAASAELGRVFDEIKSLGKVKLNGRTVNPILITNKVGKAADNVLDIQNKIDPQFRNQAIVDLAKRAKTLSNNFGRIDGEAYQLNRSALTDASHSAFAGGDSIAGHAYKALLDALDNSAESSLRAIGKGELATALRQVRPKYAALKMLEKGRVAAGGDVNPQWMATVARAQNPKAFREGGGGTMFDIGRIGEALKPLRTGSQTYGREAMSLMGLARMPFANAAARITTNPLVTGYAHAIGGAPRLANTLGLLGEAVGKPALLPPLGILFNPVMPE